MVSWILSGASMRYRVLTCAAFVLLTLGGCDRGATPAVADASAIAATKPQPEQAYVCPMHPQIVQDEPGECPICGMDLVAREIEPGPSTPVTEALRGDHDHANGVYVCPMHPQIVQDEPGECPICGMDLVAREVEPEPSTPVTEALAGDHDHSREVYVCPMHPQIVQDEPGECPICGMDLVAQAPKPEPGRQSATGDRPVVALSSALVQTLGVRTAPVERGDLVRRIRGVGRVDYDETRLVHVHPRADGWIESLELRAEGEPVRSGQRLAELYAPDILNAQVDFLLALDAKGRGGPGVRPDKARNILRLLDVPDDIIAEIEREREPRNRIPVRAPIDGVVTRMMARDGMYVTEETEMFSIADLSRVWVIVDVYEHQVDGLAVDQRAEMTVPARPGRRWEGEVDYLYPELAPATRTLRVRLVFDNPDGALKPNMFADVTIDAGARSDVLKLPAEALIVTGERESVVKALDGGTRFQPVDVTTGVQQGDAVEILSGLAEGDEVVVSGQFLIDSESSLQASFRRLSRGD
jgi:Cu(I)/Ag(I) efflux system membrane fusion protein